MTTSLKRLLLSCVIILFASTLLSACDLPSGTDQKTPADVQSETSVGDKLTVYFIDVGQADSTLIVCDESGSGPRSTMLIDGGNSSDSNLIYALLKKHSISRLDYIVATHAHEDHVGGLAGALNYASADIAFAPVKTHDSRSFNSFNKYLEKQGVSITVPKHGDKYKLGSADFEILGPVNPSNDPNNTSIVIRLIFGKTKFLFTGDAGRSAEADILENGYDISADVYKVGHHGSDTSTSYPFLREIMPKHAVISCGKNNKYGHPHEPLLSRLRDADVKVYRTDLQGTIICTSNGKNLSFKTDKNTDIQTNPTEKSNAEEAAYIGNVNSRKFHLSNCSGLPIEKNRKIFGKRSDAVKEGFEPCGRCRP